MDRTIAKAKAAPIVTVKTEVWVRNPGPMALVAMKNIAPKREERLAADITLSEVTRFASDTGMSCALSAVLCSSHGTWRSTREELFST